MAKKTNQPPLAFRQHGVSFSRFANTQWVGTCPFCGKARHLYVNASTLRWDCKSCGKKGTVADFLSEMHKRNVENLTRMKALLLSKDRAIPTKELRAAGVGYNELSDRYSIPVWYADGGGGVWDLRQYKLGGGAVMATSGLNLGICNWEALEGWRGEVWLAEGEWDWIALTAILRDSKRNAIALGCPGAGSFKREWVQMFEGHDVIVAFDHDEPGRTGAKRLGDLLQDTVRSLQFVRWPDERPEKWDVRDVYIASHRSGPQAMRELEGCLSPVPPGVDTKAPAKGKKSLDGPGLAATEVYARYRRWFHLPDNMLDVLDIVYGTVIANRIEGDPLWVFLIAPPGGFKTVPIMALDGCPNVESTDTLTPAGLISGATMAGGVDPSLLRKLHKKMLLVKDFTTVLNLPAQTREEVFGILRAAYDGKAERVLGNIGKKTIKASFGVLAAVTPAIEQYYEQHVQLGERFLGFRTPIPQGMRDQSEFLRRAHGNVGKETEIGADLRAVSLEVLNHNYGEPPEITEEISEQLISMALVVGRLRGVVTRERYSAQREVTHIPYTELPTRLIKQMTKAALGVTMFRRKPQVTVEELAVVRRLAEGSVPSGVFRAVHSMYRGGPERAWTSKEIADVIGLPEWPTTKRLLQNLVLLRAARVETVGRQECWTLTEDIVDVLSHSTMME